MQLVATAGVLGHAAQAVVVTNFTPPGGVGVCVKQRAQATQEVQVFGLALVVQVALPAVGVHRVHGRVVGTRLATPRVAAQLTIVEVKVGGVQPIAVHPQLQPEAHIVEDVCCTTGLWKFRSGWLLRKLCM